MDTGALMDELRERYGSDGLQRLEECMDILAGKRRAESDDDDQEATRIYFPGLTARAWHEPAAFTWTARVEANWLTIRDEYTRLLTKNINFYPYEDHYTGDLGWKGWDTWHLYRHGQLTDEARRLCPVTSSSLKMSPHGIREGLYSVLNPGTHLFPHTGGVNLFLTVHLPLIVPESKELGLRVGSETRSWQPGKIFIFDDSFIHESWNYSGEKRVILLWDIWHPDLNEKEIAALTWAAPRLTAYLKAH